ncbi:hypothetical protein M422DRAFT_25478 [Sphaerobolus stellatus SS14]|nr:hypothetical protein M422DRAFT_25478 [Sphaerobolus stellatus SS14]
MRSFTWTAVLAALTPVMAWMQDPLTLSSTCAPFDPRVYPKSVAQCQGMNRATSETKTLDMHYVDINPSANRTLLLVHGWPSLWSSWSNQIQHFEKDYHLIVPDLRGFGSSSHPGDVESSGTMADIVSDLVCILKHAGVDHKVVCVGHDWGAQVCWEAARMRPDLVGAVSAAVIPYIAAAGPFLPVETLATMLPSMGYQVFFEKKTEDAVAELNADIRRTLRGTFRSASSPPPADFLLSKEGFMGAWSDVEVIPPIPFMSPEEEDYLVEQFSIQGFNNTLEFYTYGNRLRTWEFDRAQGNFSIPQPALHIAPTNDPVADWEFVAKALHTSTFVPQLTTATIDAQHWPQLEEPQAFNSILRTWLELLPPL